MSKDYRQSDIAEYLKLLLEKVRQAEEDIQDIQEQQQHARELPVPWGGQANAIDPRQFNVVRVDVVVDSETFRGSRAKPTDVSEEAGANNPPHFPWEVDPDLAQITVRCGSGVTPPTEGEYVAIEFTGTYTDPDDATVKARWGYFGNTPPCPGTLVEEDFAYPHPTNAKRWDINTFEVQLYAPVFPEIPGHHCPNLVKKQVVVAHDWNRPGRWLPKGTRVQVWRTGGKWFFAATLAVRWGKAIHNWVKGNVCANVQIPWVRVRECTDSTGTNAVGPAEVILLPENAVRTANIVTNDVISFVFSVTHQAWVIQAPDGMDDKIDTVKGWWGTPNSIPNGWLCVSELVDKFPMGYCDGQPLSGGGSTTHTHTINSNTTGVTGVPGTTATGHANIPAHGNHYHALEGFTQVGVDGYLSTPKDVLLKPSPECTGSIRDPTCLPTTQTHVDAGHTHGFTPTLSDPGHSHTMAAANHLPPYHRLIFIRRIDNSYTPKQPYCPQLPLAPIGCAP